MISFRSCRDVLAEALDAAWFLAVGLRNLSNETRQPSESPQDGPADVPAPRGPESTHNDTGRI